MRLSFATGRKRVLLLALLVSAAGCTSILGTFDVASTGTGAGDAGEGGLSGADGAVVGEASSDAPVIVFDGGGEGGVTCTAQAPIEFDKGAALRAPLRLFHVGVDTVRAIDSTDVNSQAWQISSGAPSSLSVLGVIPYSVKRSSSAGVLYILGAVPLGSKLEYLTLPDGMKTATNVTLSTASQAFETASATSAASALEGGTATVSNVFFAASTNSNEDLWVGPDATATSIKNKPGTAVVNAIDYSGKEYVFTAGDYTLGTVKPFLYIVSPDTVPVGPLPLVTPVALTNGNDTATLLAVEGTSSVPNGQITMYGVTFESLNGSSLDIHAGTVMSPSDLSVDADGGPLSSFPPVYTLDSAHYPAPGGDVRWETGGQMVFATPVGANRNQLLLLWYDSVAQVVRTALFLSPSTPGAQFLAASATLTMIPNPPGQEIDVSWVETGSPSGAYYQRLNCQ